MDIAIIGAGNVGKALAGSFVRAGHNVVLTSQHFDSTVQAASATGAKAAGSTREAARQSEVVVLAVPWGAVAAVVGDAGDTLAGKIVIDATNPLSPDYSGLALTGTSGAEEIQRQAEGARVVKAFNTVLAARQADPVVGGTAVDGFVAGDDEAAKARVLELAGSIGLRPIDAGPLAMARHLESMAFLNIALQIRTGGSWQNGWKLLGPLAE